MHKSFQKIRLEVSHRELIALFQWNVIKFLEKVRKASVKIITEGMITNWVFWDANFSLKLWQVSAKIQFYECYNFFERLVWEAFSTSNDFFRKCKSAKPKESKIMKMGVLSSGKSHTRKMSFL